MHVLEGAVSNRAYEVSPEAASVKTHSRLFSFDKFDKKVHFC